MGTSWKLKMYSNMQKIKNWTEESRFSHLKGDRLNPLYSDRM